MPIALIITALLLLPINAHAQDFAYQRTIQAPGITEETSVWIPLDLHALQKDVGGYHIVDGNGTVMPFKTVTQQVNLLSEATIISAPDPADTVPAQRIEELVDGNPGTSFQPQPSQYYTFRFELPRAEAPNYLSYQLSSGWIEHVKVRLGMPGQPMRDAFVGTPSGTHIQLSGERAQIFEITFKARQGVINIAEAKLLSSSKMLLFRAQPETPYFLQYGTTADLKDLSGDTVFTDTDAITATLGSVVFIGSEANDTDGDLVPDVLDNCPYRHNTDQSDRDGDRIGDLCDNAPTLPNSAQTDKDKDGIGDAQDNCPNHSNADQKDIDLDGIGWVCDDADRDGVINSVDNCVGLSNRDQKDLDNNGTGDACEDDRDGDGVPRTEDNCSTDANPDQADEDRDGIGDICDVCPNHYDPKQLDYDDNGIGDVCQNIQEREKLEERDTDGDGVPDKDDVCPHASDPNQTDSDGDGRGNACDNCPDLQNADQLDTDNDGKGNICTDTDGDGIVDPYDNCAPYPNPDQKDKDEDGIGDPCDDEDGDRVENGRDNCPKDYNPRQDDEDSDGMGNVCDTSDDRWSEQRPWIVWIAMGLVIVVLTGLGAMILRKTKN